MAKRDFMPLGIDLFCGCGGFSLGMMQAGFVVVAAADWDVLAAITYMTNLCRHGEMQIVFITDADRDRFEDHMHRHYVKKGRPVPRAGTGWIAHHPKAIGVPWFFLGDITKLTGDIITSTIGLPGEMIDGVFGSPPCQGFSHAGKRDVDDARNNLVFEFFRLAIEIEPKTIMMENVTGIATMTTPEGIPILDACARILQDRSFSSVDAVRRAMRQQITTKATMLAFLRRKPPQEKHPADGGVSGFPAKRRIRS